MKRFLITTALITSLSGPVSAQSLADTITMGLDLMSSGGAGLTVGTREVTADGGVILRDLRFAPEGEDDVIVTAPEVVFEPVGATPGGFTMTTSAVSIIDPRVEPPLEVQVAAEGLRLTSNWMQAVAGAPNVTLIADAITVDGGDAAHPVIKALDIDITGLDVAFQGSMLTRSAEGRLNLASILADYEIADPQFGNDVATRLFYEDYKVAFTGENLPTEEEEVKAFIDQNGTFRVTVEQGAAEMDMSMMMEGSLTRMAGTAAGGSAEISLLDGVFLYRANTEPFAMNFAFDPSAVPLPPFAVSLEAMVFDVQMPVRPTEGPAPVVAQIQLTDLAVDDALWSLIDPEARIPRDPATLDIDLNARVDIDLPLVEALDGDGVGDVPTPLMLGTIDSLDINRVFLSAGGAMVEALGALSMIYQGPFPVPEGQIDITATGVQTLATLVGELGLIPPEEIAPMMGMMMIFAQRGDAPDTFTSAIEFKDGGITANGIPLQ